MVASQWQVKLVDLGGDEDAFDELTKAERLTAKQIVRIKGQLKRLALYGPALDGDYFDNVAGSKKRLKDTAEARLDEWDQEHGLR